MDLNVKDKVAVVTGGSTGIGLAIARAFAREGARVVVGSRGTSPELDELRAEGNVTHVAVDLATPHGPGELVRATVDAHGSIDILVNNAAASTPSPSIMETDDDLWQPIFDITLFSAVRTIRSAVPVMLAAGGGAIVNIGSLNARLPAPMVAPYSAAKAALTTLTTAWSEELAPQGIRVNVVSPGPVRTPMWTAPGALAHTIAAQAGTTIDDVMDRVLPETMAISTGRISEPEEVADLVLFLASERSGNITGADYVIDGGMDKSA